MQSKLRELKQELVWEYAVFKDKLKLVQTQIGKLERKCKPKSLAETGSAFLADGLPQTELQKLLWEQAYITERLNILENKLKRITAVKGEG